MALNVDVSNVLSVKYMVMSCGTPPFNTLKRYPEKPVRNFLNVPEVSTNIPVPLLVTSSITLLPVPVFSITTVTVVLKSAIFPT